MIKYNADVNIKNEDNRTALMYAASKHSFEEEKDRHAIVELLLECGADGSIVDTYGNSYLTYLSGEEDLYIFDGNFYNCMTTYRWDIKFPTLFLVSSQINIKDSIIEFFEQHFQKDQNLTFSYKEIPEEGDIEFVVEGARNEVIKDKNLWEKLQINVIYYTYDLTQDNIGYRVINLRCYLDGWYGVGLKKPSSEGYSHDIEFEYREHLENYVVNLAMDLEQHLTKIITKK